MLNILGKRYFFFALSLLIIIPGMIMLALGVPLAIDFTGGTLLEVKFASGNLPQPADMVTFLKSQGISDTQVNTTNQGTMNIRLPFIEDIQRADLTDKISQNFNFCCCYVTKSS